MPYQGYTGSVFPSGKAAGLGDGQHRDDDELESYVSTAARSPQASTSPLQDSLSAFLKRGERVAPITETEQLAMIARVHQARLDRDKLNDGRTSPRQRVEIRRALKRADEETAHIVYANFRLSQLIVNDQLSSRSLLLDRSRTLELRSELMQEASLAITEAVFSFDPERGTQWHTFMARKIRDQVRMGLARLSPLNAPASWGRAHRVAMQVQSNLTIELGRVPSLDELRPEVYARCYRWAEEHLAPAHYQLPAPEKHIEVEKKMRKQGMLGALDNLEQVMSWRPYTLSLDAPASSATDAASLGELIPGTSPSDDATFDTAELSELSALFSNILSTLEEREAEIIRLRFGFIDATSWTYQKIAEKFNVSSERIRQIERGVMERLRSPGAMFTALSAHLPSQFEEDDAESVTAAELVRRRQATAPQDS